MKKLPPDKTIIQIFRTGNITQRNEIMRLLYHKVKRSIFGMVINRGGDEDLAQSLIHDAFIEMILQIREDKFKGKTKQDRLELKTK